MSDYGSFSDFMYHYYFAGGINSGNYITDSLMRFLNDKKVAIGIYRSVDWLFVKEITVVPCPTIENCCYFGCNCVSIRSCSGIHGITQSNWLAVSHKNRIIQAIGDYYHQFHSHSGVPLEFICKSFGSNYSKDIVKSLVIQHSYLQVPKSFVVSIPDGVNVVVNDKTVKFGPFWKLLPNDQVIYLAENVIPCLCSCVDIGCVLLHNNSSNYSNFRVSLKKIEIKPNLHLFDVVLLLSKFSNSLNHLSNSVNAFRDFIFPSLSWRLPANLINSNKNGVINSDEKDDEKKEEEEEEEVINNNSNLCCTFEEIAFNDGINPIEIISNFKYHTIMIGGFLFRTIFYFQTRSSSINVIQNILKQQVSVADVVFTLSHPHHWVCVEFEIFLPHLMSITNFSNFLPPITKRWHLLESRIYVFRLPMCTFKTNLLSHLMPPGLAVINPSHLNDIERNFKIGYTPIFWSEQRDWKSFASTVYSRHRSVVIQPLSHLPFKLSNISELDVSSHFVVPGIHVLFIPFDFEMVVSSSSQISLVLGRSYEDKQIVCDVVYSTVEALETHLLEHPYYDQKVIGYVVPPNLNSAFNPSEIIKKFGDDLWSYHGGNFIKFDQQIENVCFIGRRCTTFTLDDDGW